MTRDAFMTSCEMIPVKSWHRWRGEGKSYATELSDPLARNSAPVWSTLMLFYEFHRGYFSCDRVPEDIALKTNVT